MKKADWFYKIKDVRKIFRDFSKEKENRSIVAMDKKELSSFYDYVEEGLINYNYIMQSGPEYAKDLIGKSSKRIDKSLESGLLLISLISLKKDPSKKLFKQYIDSFWADKFLNWSYFKEISDIAGISKEAQGMYYDYIERAKDLELK